MNMRKAVSVTLRLDNLLWLRGQAAATPRGSLSEVLDRIVAEARSAGRGEPAAVRSVAGTIDLPEDDPMLDKADDYIRGVVRRLGRPADARQRGSPRAKRRARAWLTRRRPCSDTHALIFHAAGGADSARRSAAYFAACERRQAILYIPVAVIWECALLARRGRINLRRSVRTFFEELFSNPAYQPYDLTPEPGARRRRAAHQSRSFDALICAAAQDLSLPLLTRDGDIRSSGAVRVIW